MEFVEKFTESLLEAETILRHSTLQANIVQNGEQLLGDSLFRLGIAHTLQHLHYDGLVAVLEATDQ